MNTTRHPMAVLVGLILISAGCAWSVPASPGRNSQARTPKATSESTATSATASETTPSPSVRAHPATEALYHHKCGRCHVPYPPTRYSAGEWPWYVNKYAPRAGLFGAERKQVLEWLQENSR